MEKLGDGNQGTVYLLEEEDGSEWAKKVYKKGHQPTQKNRSALTSFYKNLNEQDRQFLDDVAAWPQEFYDSPEPACKMQLIPKEFHYLDGNGKDRVRSASHLHARSPVIMEITDAERFRIIGNFLKAMEFFHRHGVLVGDISHYNVLWSTEFPNKVFFIDCDDMYISGTTDKPSLDTAGWQLPRVPGNCDDCPRTSMPRSILMADDDYKIGQFVLRTMFGEIVDDSGGLANKIEAKINSANVHGFLLDESGGEDRCKMPSKRAFHIARLFQKSKGCCKSRPSVSEWKKYFTQSVLYF